MPKKEMTLVIINHGDFISIGKDTSGTMYMPTYDPSVILNYDLDKYYILKGSRRFRFITNEDFINIKYSLMLLFDKEKWTKEYLQKNIDMYNKLDFILYMSAIVNEDILNKVEEIKL